MKKNVIKTAIAAVCVVAAGISGMKAYNADNQSEAKALLSENIEALSAGDCGCSMWYGECHQRPGVCDWVPYYGARSGQKWGCADW